MITKSKRQKKKRYKEGFIFQLIFYLLILFLIGFLGVSLFKISEKRTELAEKIESFEKEIQILEDEKQRLEAGISQTEKESYWEEKAREQGYVKEGENPVVVIPPAEVQKEGSVSSQGFSEMLLEKIKDLLARVIQW